MGQAEIDEAVAEYFEERAAVLQFEGGWSRKYAEYQARAGARELRRKLEGKSNGA